MDFLQDYFVDVNEFEHSENKHQNKNLTLNNLQSNSSIIPDNNDFLSDYMVNIHDIEPQYSNDNSLLTQAAALGIGWGQMLNHFLIGGTGALVDQAGYLTNRNNPLPQNAVNYLRGIGVSDNDINQINSDLTTRMVDTTGLAKSILGVHNTFDDKLNVWQKQVLGDNPTPLTRWEHGSGTSLGHAAGSFLSSYVPFVGNLIYRGGEAVSELGSFYADAYRNGMYDTNPDKVAEAGRKLFAADFVGDNAADFVADTVVSLIPGAKNVINPFARFGLRTAREVINENIQEPTQDTNRQAAENYLYNGTDFVSGLIDSTKQWPERFNQSLIDTSMSTLITEAIFGALGLSTKGGRQRVKNEYNRSKFASNVDENFKDKFDINHKGVFPSYDKDTDFVNIADVEIRDTLQERNKLLEEINNLVDNGNYQGNTFEEKQNRLSELQEKINEYLKSPDNIRNEYKKKRDEQKEHLVKDRDETIERIENFGVPYTSEKVDELNQLRLHLSNVEQAIKNFDENQGKTVKQIVDEGQMAEAQKVEEKENQQKNISDNLSDYQLNELATEYNGIDNLLDKERVLRGILDTNFNPETSINTTELESDYLQNFSNLLDRQKEIQRIIDTGDVEAADKLINLIHQEADNNKEHIEDLDWDISHNINRNNELNIDENLSEKEAEEQIRKKITGQVLDVSRKAVGLKFQAIAGYTDHYVNHEYGTELNYDAREADALATEYIQGVKSFSEALKVPLSKVVKTMKIDIQYTPMIFAVDQNGNIYRDEHGNPQYARGNVIVNSDGTRVINLSNKADRSTLIHEIAHPFFEEFKIFRNELKGVAKHDFKTLLKSYGIEHINFDNMSEQDRLDWRTASEKFATDIERYFFEGVAPNKKLLHVFNMFKRWLTNVYGNIEDITYTDANGKTHTYKLRPEVKKVIDHIMLGGEAKQGLFSKIADKLNDKFAAKTVKNFIPKEDIEKYNQPMYHATEHIIENNKFDLSKMGSGEGNRKYGWGVYQAKVIESAEGYRDLLQSKIPDLEIVMSSGRKFLLNSKNDSFFESPSSYFYNANGSRFFDYGKKFPDGRYYTDNDFYTSNNTTKREIDDEIAIASQYLYEFFYNNNYRGMPPQEKARKISNDMAIKSVNFLPDTKVNITVSDGSENELLLNYTKKYSRQSKHVQNGLDKLRNFLDKYNLTNQFTSLIDYPMDYDSDYCFTRRWLLPEYHEKLKKGLINTKFEELTGQQIYETLSKTFAQVLDMHKKNGKEYKLKNYGKVTYGDELASLILNACGIPGNSHQDEFGSEFCIWNTDTLKLLGYTNDSSDDAKKYFTKTRRVQNEKSDIYNQFVGVPAARRLDKEEGTTERIDNLKIAKTMKKHGLSDEKIWFATGWYRPADEGWRWEIMDGEINTSKQLSIFPRKSKYYNNSVITTTLGNLYDNPALYIAYPELKNMPVEFRDFGDKIKTIYNIEGHSAFYSSANKKIVCADIFTKNIDNPNARKLSRLEKTRDFKHLQEESNNGQSIFTQDYWYDFLTTRVGKEYNRLINEPSELKETDRIYPTTELRSPLIHEIQHAVQDIEGFAHGINTDATQKIIDSYENREKEIDEIIQGDDYYTKDTRGTALVTNTRNKIEREFNDRFKGAPMDAQKLYHRSGGEIDARNAQKRANMTAEGRKAIPPSKTQDVPNSQWLNDNVFNQAVKNDKTFITPEQIERYNQQFYHATGHILKDNKFDLNKVLSGSGANNEGYGIYGAEVLAEAEPYRKAGLSNLLKRGNIYIVEGPENDELLDCDKTINKQPKFVREARREILSELKYWGIDTERVKKAHTGEEFYKALSRAMLLEGENFVYPQKGISNPAQRASLILNMHGVPGLRFNDYISDGKKKRTHDFVIWNTKTLELLGLTEDSDEDAKEYFRKTKAEQEHQSKAEVYNQYMGVKAARLADERDGTTERMDNYKMARRMKKHGLSDDKIWFATGWWQAPDKGWRWEIMDGEIRTYWELEDYGNGTFSSPLSLIYDNPQLFKAYPHFSSYKVYFENIKDNENGYFNPNDWTIHLSNKYVVNDIDGNPHVSDEAFSTLIHEIQHAIQRYEGFRASGTNLTVIEKVADKIKSATKAIYEKIEEYDNKIGLGDYTLKLEEEYKAGRINDLYEITKKEREFQLNSKYGKEYRRLFKEKDKIEDRLHEKYGTIYTDEYKLYKRNGGEMNARAVQARANMTEEERKATSPDNSFDIPIWDWLNDEVYNQVFGEKGARQADEAEGVTTRMDNLDVAKQMIKQGLNPKKIKLATGWELDRRDNNNWKYEEMDGELIPNAKFSVEHDFLNGKSTYWETTLKSIWDAPELYKAYPFLKDLPINNGTETNIASYHREDKYLGLPANITINKRYVNSNGSLSNNETRHAFYLPNLRSALIHELQHAIQDYEGFSNGGNPNQFKSDYDNQAEKRNSLKNELRGLIKEIENISGYTEHEKNLDYKNMTDEEISDDFDNFWNNSPYKEIKDELNNYWRKLTNDSPHERYLTLPGEREARNMEIRKDFTPEQRRNSLLSETEDDEGKYSEYTFDEVQEVIDKAKKLINEKTDKQLNAETYNQTISTDDQLINSQEQLNAVRQKYEGTDQWLKAPNGKKSNLNEKQWLQVRTPNFKRWFGNWENDVKNTSKVLDNNGEPLVLYRGTPSKMGAIFEYGKNFYGGNLGFWFTTAKTAAEDYAFDNVTGNYGEVKAIFLNANNILDLTPLKLHCTSKQFCDYVRSKFNVDLGRGSSKRYRVNELYEKYQKQLYSLGEYDCIKLSDVGTTYIAKLPNQIKSATDNNGNFNPVNPEIYNQAAHIENQANEIYNQIGKARKTEMDKALTRYRTDLTPEQRKNAINEIEKLGEQVKPNGDPKTEKLAIKWLLGGHIILPEDNYKILNAIKISEQHHFDPMQYADPNEILAKYTMKKTKAELRTNPDEVPEFSGKYTYPNGITVYDVDNSLKGLKAVRNIIDTHWGEKANPWCLVARLDEDEIEIEDLDETLNDLYDDGAISDEELENFDKENDKNLISAIGFWRDYSGIEKRIAFKDGELVAFSASDDDEIIWWDREDNSHDGIPYRVKDNNGFTDYIYNEGDKEAIPTYAKLSDGTERYFYKNGNMKREILPDKTENRFDEDGYLVYKILPDGTIYEYDKKGNIKDIYREVFNQTMKSPNTSNTEELNAREQPETYNQFIGVPAAHRLDKLAKTTEFMDNLTIAKEMKRAGIDDAAIWRRTGWWKAPDKKWRMEIMDGNVDRFMIYDIKDLEDIPFETTLGDVYNNPELYKAYPQLENMKVIFRKKISNDENTYGKYKARDKIIMIKNTRSAEQIQSTLLHEIQHAIQDIEGFSRGGGTPSILDLKQELLYDNKIKRLEKRLGKVDKNSDEYDKIQEQIDKIKDKYESKYGVEYGKQSISFNYYRRLGGEIEARNVQEREKYPEYRRRDLPPFETQDVENNKWISKRYNPLQLLFY